MLTNYKQNCEELMKGRLESVTRYKFENLKLENYKEFVVECNIEVVNSMSVTYTERRVAGGGKSGELHYNSSEYEQSISNHCDREYNDENFALLASYIQSGSYAKYADKSTFKYGSTILCEYRCGKCNGKGEYKCDKCMGKGELRCSSCQGKGETRCNECGGKGEYKCKQCLGTGEIEYNWGQKVMRRCQVCNGLGIAYCSNCNKTGWKRCYSCSGSGYKTCSRCDGKTILICDSCKGSGSVTDIADILIQTTPKYTVTFPKDTTEQVKSIIQSNMVANIKNIANATRLDIKVDDSNKKVVENYKIQVPFATFHLTFNDTQFEYTIYGKNLQIEKWHDDIVPTILANDVKILAKLAKESSFFSTKILAKSQVAVANFMESQVNKDIINADSKVNNERYSEIDDRVSQIKENIRYEAVKARREAKITKLDRKIVLLGQQEENANEMSQLDSEIAKLESEINQLEKDFKPMVSDEYIAQTIKSLHKMASRFCLAVRLKYISIAFLISFVFMFCSGYGMFIKAVVVLVIFVCVALIIQYIEQSNIKKIWGEDLANWAEKRDIFAIKTYKENDKDKAEFNNKQFNALFWISLIAVFVAAGLMNSYVITFDDIKSKITNLTQSTKSTQTKQPVQNKQTQKQTQSTQNMIRCNDKLINYIVKLYKEDLIKEYKSNPKLLAGLQEILQQNGVAFTNIDDFVNQSKFFNVTISRNEVDEANKQIFCGIDIEMKLPFIIPQSDDNYRVISRYWERKLNDGTTIIMYSSGTYY